MKSFVALALAASALAKPMPMPQSSTPEGCSDSHDGGFQITVVNVTSSEKRDIEKRQQSGILTLTLSGGDLKDQAGRTGYIASNFQFQFDSPPQENAITTSGFSLCSNNSLALGGSAIWYQCWSGDFFNLYDRHWADQCSPIYLVAQGGGTDPPVTQISDGQPGASTAIPITQISDGQPQVPTGAPVTQISDGQPQVPTGAPVTQISDGQPQVPTGAPVTQISDGQPQAPTGPAVTQISDGQPQAPSGPVVSQISDGQPQVPSTPADTVTGAPSVTPGPPITQISDGQPQAPAPTGNFTVPNGTAIPSPSEFPGAAAAPMTAAGSLAMGLFAMFAML